MQEQIDALCKIKAKIEKDKQTIMGEIGDARAATDEVVGGLEVVSTTRGMDSSNISC